MTKNTALNYLRDRKVNLNVIDLSLMDDTGTEDLYYKQEKILIMRMLVEKMPPQRQKVFKMSRLNGLSNDQIAEILGISKKTVENHMTDALRVLRKALA
jgi:RNA polymerase sigma-70 factor (ECF subfamily)